ncbi:MAG: hypothetical protein ACR2FY_14205 [Pirellulaceae bacterium]
MKILSLLSWCALALFLAGCGPQQPARPAPPPVTETLKEGHENHGAGPHGGTIAEWGGGKYHIEFTVDHEKKESAVYVLGGDAKTPAPIKAEKLLLTITEPSFQVDLVAQPLDGESGGAASRFVGQHDSLGKVQEFAGSVTTEVDGTPYAGDFKEESHDHKKE